MTKLKKLLALCLALALVLCLAACGSTSEGDAGTSSGDAASSDTNDTNDTDDTDDTDDDDYKVFNYGTDANSTTFDPASDLQTNSGNFLVHAVGETLWTVDEDGNMTLKLAESVDYTAEALTIIVKQGIQFSNGNEMTAEDVLFTINHMASQARTESMYTALNLAEAEIQDEYTLVIPMNNYDAALIDLLGNASCMILDSETFDADNADWLIGTGPYMLQGDGETDTSGWEESVKYTLVRNPYYWGEEPYYDEFNVYFYSEESTRYADFQDGNLDAIYVTDTTYINNLGDGAVSGASLIQKAENAVYGFALASGDNTTGTFSDINVRMAFAHCLDVESMVESLGEGVYMTASSLVGEDCWAYEDLGVYEYDPDAAAAYLAEAGYSTDNPLTIYVYAESTSWSSALFEAAQAYASAIGINLDLTGLADFATILPTLLANEHDMTMSTGSNGSGNDPANLLQQFGPLSNNELLRVTDSTLVELYETAQASEDQAERTELYQQFIETIYENYLYVPVYVGTKNYGVLDTHSSFEAAIDTSNQVDPTLLTD